MNNTQSNINRRIFFIIFGIILVSALIIILIPGQSVNKYDPDTMLDTKEGRAMHQEKIKSLGMDNPASSIGEQNALNSATGYINYSDFSEQKLRDQLKYEGFTEDEIDYAIDNVIADYNQEASDRATIYYTTQSLSKARVIQQLEYEGYTQSQIEYAIGSLPE